MAAFVNRPGATVFQISCSGSLPHRPPSSENARISVAHPEKLPQFVVSCSIKTPHFTYDNKGSPTACACSLTVKFHLEQREDVLNIVGHVTEPSHFDWEVIHQPDDLSFRNDCCQEQAWRKPEDLPLGHLHRICIRQREKINKPEMSSSDNESCHPKNDKKTFTDRLHVSALSAANPSSCSDSNSINNDFQMDAEPTDLSASESDLCSTTSSSSYGYSSCSQLNGHRSKSFKPKRIAKTMDAVIYHADEDSDDALEVLKKIKDIMQKNSKQVSIFLSREISVSTACESLQKMCLKSRLIVLFVTKSFDRNKKTQDGLEFLWRNKERYGTKFSVIKWGYAEGEHPHYPLFELFPSFIKCDNSESFDRTILCHFQFSQEKSVRNGKSSKPRASRKQDKNTGNKGTCSSGNSQADLQRECEGLANFRTNKVNDKKLENGTQAERISRGIDTASLTSWPGLSVTSPQSEDTSILKVIRENRTEQLSPPADFQPLATSMIDHQNCIGKNESDLTSDVCADSVAEQLSPDPEVQPSDTSGNTQPHPVRTSKKSLSLKVLPDVNDELEQLSRAEFRQLSVTSGTAQSDLRGTSNRNSSLNVVSDSCNEQLHLRDKQTSAQSSKDIKRLDNERVDTSLLSESDNDGDCYEEESGYPFEARNQKITDTKGVDNKTRNH